MSAPRTTIYLTMLVFLLEPLPFGAWLALIPHVKEVLGLDKAELALALLGMPAGVIPSLQLGGWLVGRIGPRRMLAAALPLQALAIYLPLVAPSLFTLFLSLMLLGGVIAILQISLNAYAGRLEKARNIVVMNRCHGFWALGVMLGSLLVALMPGLSPLAVMSVIAWPSALLGIWAALSLERFQGQEGGKAAPRRRLSEMPRRLMLISLVTLAASITEGAMSDWSAVYLAERLEGDTARAGIAVSIFAGFLALGRFLGDAAKVQLGVVRLARVALGCAAVGLGLLVIPLPLWTSYLGFGLVGLGVSVGFPLGVSAAAGLDDHYEGPNIALLSTVTMIGFLIGPPLIGTIGEAHGLRVGLAALLPGLIIGIALAHTLKHPDSSK